MAFVAFLAFFFISIQALVTRCAILGMLAFLCLISCIYLILVPKLPYWARLLAGAIPVTLLCLIVYHAGWLDMLYLGRIPEYRYAAIESSAMILVNFTSFIPEGKIKKHHSASAKPSTQEGNGR